MPKARNVAHFDEVSELVRHLIAPCVNCDQSGVLVSAKWKDWEAACRKVIESGSSKLPKQPKEERSTPCPTCCGTGANLTSDGWTMAGFLRLVFGIDFCSEIQEQEKVMKGRMGK